LCPRELHVRSCCDAHSTSGAGQKRRITAIGSPPGLCAAANGTIGIYFTPMPCSRRRPRALLAPALRGCTHPRGMLQPAPGSTHGRADDCANPVVCLPQGQRPRARPRDRRHRRRGGDFSTVGSRIGRAPFGTTRLITGTSRCRRQARNTMAADSHCAAMRRSRRPNRMPGGGHRESKVGRYCNRRSCSHGK
jgi:hypothetical protein